MSKLVLVITQAGQARFAAAQLGDAIDLQVSRVGLTADPFIVAPTLTSLPGEFRSVETVSGAIVGDNVVHMVVRDAEPLAYTVRGFGLYLADGTLLAAYCHDAPLFEKSTASQMHLALDIAFPAGQAEVLSFGDTNFLNPPATTQTKGVAELATQGEVDTGTDDRRIVTPLTLAQRLLTLIPRSLIGKAGGVASLGGDGLVPRAQSRVWKINNKEGAEIFLNPGDLGAVPYSRIISADQLCKGGGDLLEDVHIRVESATGEEALAATRNDVAVTPASLAAFSAGFAETGEYQPAPGIYHKLGTKVGPFSEGGVDVGFHTFFPTRCMGVFVTSVNGSGSTLKDIYMQRSTMSVSGFRAFVQKAGSDGDQIDSFDWLAIGC